jgi:hypothetical protein
LKAIITETYVYTLEVKDKEEIKRLKNNDERSGTLLTDRISEGSAKLQHIKRTIQESWS